MCRFLIQTTRTRQPALARLHAFADMARDSQVSPGKWQGDGWGVAWRDDNDCWQLYKSLRPVWEDREVFAQVPASTCVVAHARAASFDRGKGVIEVNQPYLGGGYAFVFNGWLKGVRFSPGLPGEIGAQKLWALLQGYLREAAPPDALNRLRDWLIAHTQFIGACNIALTDGAQVYALSMYQQRGEYYNLRYARDAEACLLVSEPIAGAETAWLMKDVAVLV